MKIAQPQPRQTKQHTPGQKGRVTQQAGKSFSMCNNTDRTMYACDGVHVYTIERNRPIYLPNPNEANKLIVDVKVFDSEHRRSVDISGNETFIHPPLLETYSVPLEDLCTDTVYIPGINLLLGYVTEPNSLLAKHPNTEENIEARFQHALTVAENQPIKFEINDPKARVDYLYFNFNGLVVQVDVSHNEREDTFCAMYVKQETGYIKDYVFDLDEIIENRVYKHTLIEDKAYMFISHQKNVIVREAYNDMLSADIKQTVKFEEEIEKKTIENRRLKEQLEEAERLLRVAKYEEDIKITAEANRLKKESEEYKRNLEREKLEMERERMAYDRQRNEMKYVADIVKLGVTLIVAYLAIKNKK